MELIFEKSVRGHRCTLLPELDVPLYEMDESVVRDDEIDLPEIAEIDLVRHYTNLAKETFGVDKPTAEQVKYVTQQLIPSSYLLAHHTLRGHGITFNVPNRESSNAQAHRP